MLGEDLAGAIFKFVFPITIDSGGVGTFELLLKEVVMCGYMQ